MESRLRRALELVDEKLLSPAQINQSSESSFSSLAYCPWSQISFIDRCSSFDWSWASRATPADVSTCARYGWEGDGHNPNTIVCTACKAQLYLPWSEELVEESAIRIVASEYFEKISNTGHATSGCPWRIKPCEEYISQANYHSLAVERELLLKRYRTFENVHVNAPSQELFDAADVLQMISGGIADTVDNLHLGGFCLALTQWELINIGKGNPPLITCRFGCTRISLSTGPFHAIDGHVWFCPFMRSGDFDTFLALWKDHLTKTVSNQPSDYYPLLTKFTTRQVQEIVPKSHTVE